eukprot:1511499-Pleurochrysis_carterae.AAC.1
MNNWRLGLTASMFSAGASVPDCWKLRDGSSVRSLKLALQRLQMKPPDANLDASAPRDPGKTPGNCEMAACMICCFEAPDLCKSYSICAREGGEGR